jgi:hypothetical protein
VLHDVGADQHSGAAQACLAVDGQCAWCRLRNGQELQQDLLAGAGAIREVQLVVLEAPVQEALAVVHLQHRTAVAGVWWPRWVPKHSCLQETTNISVGGETLDNAWVTWQLLCMNLCLLAATLPATPGIAVPGKHPLTYRSDQHCSTLLLTFLLRRTTACTPRLCQ